MNCLQDDSTENSHHIEKEKALLLNTIEVLDDEKENFLTEVLRCYVCLELPKGKQVRICEEGHHCCLTCHKKIKFCGICRGALLEGRNFVVEQLVTKLGPILELPKNNLPAAEPPKILPPGYYQCLHKCHIRVPAFQMLPHLRSYHSVNLLENVRSNPYSSRFSLRLNIQFTQDEKYVFSIQVSDMGLFTLVVDYIGLDFFACVHMLADKEIASLFRYHLTLKVDGRESKSSMEFSMTNGQVCSYLDNIKEIRTRGNCLKILGAQLLEYSDVGSALTLFVSIWEKKEKLEKEDKANPTFTCIPERHLYFENDRRTRRNRNRNIRRNRIKQSKMENMTSLVERLYDMAL